MEPTAATGEFGLIDWIRRRLPRTPGSQTSVGIGDDCAVLDLPAGCQLLVTTDMLMDGRHFRLNADGAEAVGYKAMGVNLSDIAAMAGVPLAAVVSVALPRGQAVALGQGLTAGLERMARRFAVDLVGGDTNAWDGSLVINVAVLGQAGPAGPVRRCGARPGDVIVVTGPLGGSLWKGRHLRPEPRIHEALALQQAAPLAAMIDLSDGLSSDLGHILAESGGLGATLEADAIPIHPDAVEASAGDGIPALEHALHDGEDFELCITLRPEAAKVLLGKTPPPARIHAIGTVTAGPGVRLRLADGETVPLPARGFDHFRA